MNDRKASLAKRPVGTKANALQCNPFPQRRPREADSGRTTVRDNRRLLRRLSCTSVVCCPWPGGHSRKVHWGDTGHHHVAREAQVFQLWWYALNERALAPGVAKDAIRAAFPEITSVERREQKRRLHRMIERHRGDRSLLADPRTETGPLLASV